MVSHSAMKNVRIPWLVSVATIGCLSTQVRAEPTAASESAPKAAPASDAQPTKEQCIDSHRQSQQAQNEGKLVHARELARTCTSLACPGLLISDCARWLSDLDQRIPSVVFEVRVDGQPNLEAAVTADEKPVTEWTRGESLRLDPGEHQFRFELKGYDPIVQNLLLAEGMRFRVVSVDFKKKPSASAAITPVTPVAPASSEPVAVKERPTPFIVYPLLGLGVLGGAGFATFALLGNAKEKDLKDSCSPNCSDADLKPMKRNYTPEEK